MSKKNNPVTLDPFQAWCHRWGRIGTLLALVYMVSLPFIFLSVYDCVPSLGEVFNVATIGILAIYIPVGLSEALSYTPLMGTSSYLGFITGNIMNLKLPCAVNALKLTGKQANTPEGDVVASIAVAASSIMTVAILTVAALLIRMISPIFELPAVQTMSSYLLPALFGSMTLGLFASTSAGDKVVKGGLKGVIPVYASDRSGRYGSGSGWLHHPGYAACCHHHFPRPVEEGQDRRGGQGSLNSKLSRPGRSFHGRGNPPKKQPARQGGFLLLPQGVGIRPLS